MRRIIQTLHLRTRPEADAARKLAWKLMRRIIQKLHPQTRPEADVCKLATVLMWRMIQTNILHALCDSTLLSRTCRVCTDVILFPSLRRPNICTMISRLFGVAWLSAFAKICAMISHLVDVAWSSDFAHFCTVISRLVGAAWSSSFANICTKISHLFNVTWSSDFENICTTISRLVV